MHVDLVLEADGGLLIDMIGTLRCASIVANSPLFPRTLPVVRTVEAAADPFSLGTRAGCTAAARTRSLIAAAAGTALLGSSPRSRVALPLR